VYVTSRVEECVALPEPAPITQELDKPAKMTGVKNGIFNKVEIDPNGKNEPLYRSDNLRLLYAINRVRGFEILDMR
jgi:hypothetical protein